MEIQLKRLWPKAKYTMGRMFVDGKYYCDTLEPPERKQHGCVPKGRYKVTRMWMNKVKEMRPLLMDVPGRSEIFISEGCHVSNTLGNVLVGRNTSVGYLSDSKKTLKPLMQKITTALLKGDEVMISVEYS